MQVHAGDDVRSGALLGRASAGDAQVTVELRHGGRPFSIAPLLG
jgi:hypothetical protein